MSNTDIDSIEDEETDTRIEQHTTLEQMPSSAKKQHRQSIMRRRSIGENVLLDTSLKHFYEEPLSNANYDEELIKNLFFK